MESNIISASDLLKNLSEDYKSYEKDFVFCQNEKELKKAKFRLLLSIVFKEYTKAIDDIDNIDTNKEIPKKEAEEDSDVFETSCADKDFSPMVSPNGDFGISLKNAEKNSVASNNSDSDFSKLDNIMPQSKRSSTCNGCRDHLQHSAKLIEQTLNSLDKKNNDQDVY